MEADPPPLVRRGFCPFRDPRKDGVPVCCELYFTSRRAFIFTCKNHGSSSGPRSASLGARMLHGAEEARTSGTAAASPHTSCLPSISTSSCPSNTPQLLMSGRLRKCEIQQASSGAQQTVDRPDLQILCSFVLMGSLRTHLAAQVATSPSSDWLKQDGRGEL